MLDLALVAFIGLFLALGLKRPFFWVLAYIYIDVVAPQKIGWGFLHAMPVSLGRVYATMYFGSRSLRGSQVLQEDLTHVHLASRLLL